MALKLSSRAFGPGEAIPTRYTAEGQLNDTRDVIAYPIVIGDQFLPNNIRTIPECRGCQPSLRTARLESTC